eukprot:CAMPEP_0170356630 /NCGR_PEP_ID=MMETSP0117_2-20130122/1278_1 /TAXON_ID=400756 /ORGANISM="Durinskia baltica, Strain CSIRO CS-38" /LENGTH=111 /DNA_ID=CAMNT_0010610747 /DNA_START=90 /DNA_END=425 /DNA_ORIENTATION=+
MHDNDMRILLQSCPNLDLVKLCDATNFKADFLMNCSTETLICDALLPLLSQDFSAALMSMKRLKNLTLKRIALENEEEDALVRSVVLNCPFLEASQSRAGSDQGLFHCVDR